uniref:Odorant receptor n=1 Tax=Epiphyas postvittana TaxID=65032 RepID=A0A0K8TU90_EPIPO
MDEGHLTNVYDLTYVKMVRFTLNCIGAWPNKDLGNSGRSAKILSIYNYCLLITCSMAMVFEFKYLKKNTGVQDFTVLGHTYITLFMGLLFVQRLTMPMQRGYCNVMKEFFTKFHLIHSKTRSKYADKMNTRVQKLCFIFSIMSHFQLYSGVFFYNLIPVYKNYSSGMFSEIRPVNGTFEQSIFYDLIIDQYTDTYWYLIVSIFNVFLSFTVVCSYCCFDLLICLNVFHIWGHLNILKDNINNFRKPEKPATVESPAWFTEEESKLVHQELCAMIEYHKMITEFMAQKSSAYSVFLYLYFIFHQVSGCVLLLEVSQMDAEALGKYGLLTFSQFEQLILMSIVFELISTKGETIIDDVYALPWECMDSKNRKTVAFFLMNVQKPMAIKAGDMVPVGVQTMFAIIKASCSYFVMLTAFAQEED